MEFLTILVIILSVGSCLRLAIYFYKLVCYHHLLHQLNPLDDFKVSRIFSDVLEEYHCTKQISVFQVPGLSSPTISGLLHPVILLPDSKYSEQDLRFIFMHELNHYLHHDLWKSLFGSLKKTQHIISSCKFIHISGKTNIICIFSSIFDLAANYIRKRIPPVNTFSQFLHIGCISLLFILSLCFIFQPSSPPSNLDDDDADND